MVTRGCANTSPLSSSTRPARTRSSVDFPEPLRPTRQTRSPRAKHGVEAGEQLLLADAQPGVLEGEDRWCHGRTGVWVGVRAWRHARQAPDAKRAGLDAPGSDRDLRAARRARCRGYAMTSTRRWPGSRRSTRVRWRGCASASAVFRPTARRPGAADAFYPFVGLQARGRRRSIWTGGSPTVPCTIRVSTARH